LKSQRKVMDMSPVGHFQVKRATHGHSQDG
jgi:hypothetical protein